MSNPNLPENAELAPDDNPNRILNADGESVAGPMPTEVTSQTDYQALLHAIPLTEIGLFLSQDETARKSVMGIIENRPQEPASPAYVTPSSATGR
jgi:hypothetical protein